MRAASALAVVGALAAADAAQAGAWPMEAGRIQAISMITYDTADRSLNTDGDAVLDADFTKVEASSFLEWGLTPRLTLIAQPVVQNVEQRAPGGGLDHETGFASSQVGARWLLGRPAGGALSVQGALVAPGQAENLIDAPLGEGGLAAETRLLAGRGWGGEDRGIFIEGQIGYRWRGGGDPDEARFDATFGVRPSPDWMVIGQSFSIWSERPEDVARREFRSHKAQLSVVRRVNERFSLQFGGFGTYAGRNVVEERAAFASVWMRFQPGSPFAGAVR